MKRNCQILSVTCALVLCQGVYAQTNSISTGIDIGYGFPSGSQSFTNVNGSLKTIVPYSLGAGFNLAFQGNYMFSDNVGGGLDLNVLFGTPAVNINNPTGGISTTTISKGSLFTITPHLLITTNNEVVNPYARVGLVIGFPSYTVSTTESGATSSSGTNIDSYTGNVAVGLYSALGIKFRITDQINFHVELFDRDLNYSPILYTNTQAFNGDPKMDSEILVNSTANRYSATTLTTIAPFGSIGLKAGLEWKFNT